MYLKYVDGLRAIAVLGVMIAHYQLPFGHGGFLGVDVFFVISGFLITRLLAREASTASFSYARFYLRRIRRLLPGAISVIALTIILFLPILSNADLKDFLKSVPASILPVANIYFYQSIGYFDTDATVRPFLHFWSLAVEEQFYFIWPTVLLALLKYFPKSLSYVSLAILIASLFASEFTRSIDFNATYYLLPFRVFELMVGAQLAIFMQAKAGSSDYLPKPSTVKRESAFAFLGMFLILCSFFVLDEASGMPGALSLIPCLGTVLLIRFGAAGPVGVLLQKPLTVWIGNISYSLYLVHWPIYVYVFYRLPEEPSLWLKLALFPVAIAIAAVNYYLVEKAFRKPADPSKRFGNWPVLSGILAASVVLVIPTYLKYTDSSFAVRTADADILPASAVAKVASKPWLDASVTRKIKTYQPHGAGPDAPRILLLGDSHAGHIETGLVHLLVPQGIVLDVATSAGCPPLFGAARYYDAPNREVEQRICAEISMGEKERLVLEGGYDGVILSARWMSMLERSDFGDLSGRHDLLVDASTIYSNESFRPTELDAVELKRSRTLFAKKMDHTLARIVEAGKPVVVFGQVPALGNNLSRCFSLFPWVTSNMPFNESSRCAQLSADKKMQRAKFTDEVISKTAQKNGALAILPTEVFCEDDPAACLMVNLSDEQNTLFRDSNHLSLKGSVDLIQKADSVFNLTSFLLKGRPSGL